MALIFQGLDTQQALGPRQKQDMMLLGGHKRLALCAWLSYYSLDTAVALLMHGVRPCLLWRHSQRRSSSRRPREAPFFCSLCGKKAGEAHSGLECGTRKNTLKGQRCSFGRQPSLAPPPRGVCSWCA